MRFLIVIFGFCASAASAQNYADRSVCMNELSKMIATAEAFSNQREVRSFQFESVPDFGDQHVEQIIQSFEDIESAWQTIADEMFTLCSKYPPA